MPSRRAVLAAGAAGLTVGLAGCNGSRPPPESTFDEPTTRWPNAGYDPAGTGHAPAGPEDASREWQTAPGATDPPLYGAASAPAVAGDTVFVAGLATWRFDEEDESALVAFDAATGEAGWSETFPDGVSGAPIAIDNVVILGGRDGALHALADGIYVWSIDLGGQVGTPTAYGKRFYVADSRGNVHAANRDGEKLWTADRDGVLPDVLGEPRPLDVRPPAVDDEGVYVLVESRGEADATLLAYDHSGSKRWRSDLSGRYGSDPRGPAVADGRVYATVGGTVHARAAATGEREWRFATGAGSAGPPSTDGERLYVAAGNLHALDPADGTERWRLVNESLGAEHGQPYLARPAVADGRVYLRAGAVDAADGTWLWRDDAIEGDDAILVDEVPLAQPVVTGDAVYYRHVRNGLVKLS